MTQSRYVYFAQILAFDKWRPVSYVLRPEMRGARVQRKDGAGPLLRRIPNPWAPNAPDAYLISVPRQDAEELGLTGINQRVNQLMEKRNGQD